MKLHSTIVLLVGLAFASVPASARDMTTKWPFAFVNDFPEIAGNLGFETGRRLAVGIFVISGDSPVKEVVLRNVDTGVELNASSLENTSRLFAEQSEKPILFQVKPTPDFEADRHTGIWKAIITDEQGNEVTDRTHNLDIVGSLPAIKDVRASGDPLTPTISWSVPDIDTVPDRCVTSYRVRLLKSRDMQFHRSKKLSTMEYKIPDGVLKDSDLPETYVRIQFSCADKEESEHSVPTEISSETFVPLQTLLNNAN